MLQSVLHIHRHCAGDILEDWPDFLKRSAAGITETIPKYGMLGWVTTRHKRKWQLVVKLARATADRWSQHILKLQPRCGHGRSAGRPHMRWADPSEVRARGHWMTLARDVRQRDAAEDAFTLA